MVSWPRKPWTLKSGSPGATQLNIPEEVSADKIMGWRFLKEVLS